MAHSRRGFLKNTLGAAWTGASLLEQAVFRAAHANAFAAANAGAKLFDIEKVADGVYGAVPRPVPILNCNAVVFELSDGVLIVDTHSKPSAAAALAAQLKREVSGKPVKYVVNSHFHWDHSQGGAAYRKLSPKADVIASEATRRLLSEQGTARLKASLDQAGKSIAALEERIAKTKDAAERRTLEQQVADTRAYLAEMRGYAPELPNVTFDRDLIIHDKAQELRLLFRGRAHTSGDVYVWSPSRKVIATGDVLHGFLPFIGDGYPKDWPNTLLKIAELDFQHVIGGHGSVQHTRGPLQQMAAYIDELTDIVSRNFRKPLEQIQQMAEPARMTSLRHGYGDFLVGEAKKFGRQEGGPAEFLRAGVRTNVADVHKALARG